MFIRQGNSILRKYKHLVQFGLCCVLPGYLINGMCTVSRHVNMLTLGLFFSTDSVESLSHTNSSVQASPAVSTHTSRITDPSYSVDSSVADTSTEENRSESDSAFIPDYLYLPNCESGKVNTTRYVSQTFCVNMAGEKINRKFLTIIQNLYIPCQKNV